MQRRLGSLLWRLGLAFGAVAATTVLTMALNHLKVSGLAPFLFLFAVLACAWVGSYVAGIASVLFAAFISVLVTRKSFGTGPLCFYSFRAP